MRPGGATCAPLRLVVFDVDGTLVDSQADILAAMGRAFASVGLEVPDRETVLSIVGLSLDVAVARLAPHASEAEQAAMVEGYRGAYMALRAEKGSAESSPLYPGALAALDALATRSDWLLGIATGKSRRGLDKLLAGHGLAARFVTTQVADSHPSKPHPAMLKAALDETGVEAACAVMVGDTTYDMEMARAAGLGALGVSWGYHPAEALKAAGAGRVLGHFDELAPALDEIWETAR